MNFVSVENVSKAFGERVLFENISFGINEGQKIGFVAKNGTGKSSLLNIITKSAPSDTGQVVYRKGLKVAFLPQEPNLDPQLSIEETIFTGDNESLQAIEAYEKAVLNPEDADAFQAAFDRMDQAQAWDFETEYKQILSKLKLDNLSLKVASLSGGQKKRLALTNVLLSKPELVFLDEPTNHLDLEMIEWLEEYFAKEKITLFMITHDRYFLENVCNEIVELDHGKLYNYRGNYAYYLEKKEQRLTAEATELSKAKHLFKKELDWMRRQPKARTTKSKSRIDDFFEIKKKAHQRRADHQVTLEINMERMGSKIIEFHKVSKSYGDLVITNKFDYVFQRGERIGIIGKNGTGKSSFLNLLTGIELPDSGKVITGETIKIGYYTQKGIKVKEGQKVIDVIREFGDYIPLKKGRQISAGQLLEQFLFDRKKQHDFVEKLSGGERKRLYLCTVLIQNPNFLILDEPTNDLDIVTLNVLESFLLDFPGCLAVVSHDRYFMDKIVDHLFVFEGKGVIEDFPGNYSDYRAYENSPKTKKEPEATITPEVKQHKNSWKKEQKNTSLSFNEQKEYNKIERELKKLELQKKEIEQQFATENFEGDALIEKSKELGKITNAIEEKEMRWMELAEKMG
ncbi:ABC-F family ATP-binding cassette domain-containing protein [Aquimarina agarilytica]|uniref:ABC-F family ATP-binding cassette domain-containing protein n=1 Tax=Aquimarina agarilytica TaxID=1087449 RepID=UPI00049284E7|nr:ABC-F family ATP-binding cassette domain-containing protein [Aquimarina agarilytica]